MNRLRGSDIGMIFQDPWAYMNPVLKIGKQITESIVTHKRCNRKQAGQEALKLLDMVGIRSPRGRLNQYPFELSGGMLQRAAIAAALACKPKLLIADEPTTALDATVQKQIIDLLKRISEETDTAVIMVTHDLGAAAALCRRILVMKDGRIVETDDTDTIFREPREQYTRELLSFARSLQRDAEQRECGEILLKVERVSKQYQSQSFWPGRQVQEAIADVSLSIRAGETFGIVGESGSGKTTLARMAAGVITPTSGSIRYRNVPAADLDQSMKWERQMVFQQTYASLNPRFSVKQILAEPLLHRAGCNKDRRAEEIVRMISLVDMQVDDLDKYPHQLSGGQRQRVGIARALITKPKLVICDEPVSSLDISVQAQILELLQEVQREQSLAYLFISHDLNVVRRMCQRLGVMYFGSMVESGKTAEVYQDPWHPYTKELLNAALIADPKKAKRKKPIPVKEEVRSLHGCPYLARCGYAMACCSEEKPQSYRFGQREVACFLYSEEHSGKRSPDYVMTAQV